MKTIVAAIAASLVTIAAPASGQDSPTLYHGGPIITMDGDTPQTVEAVVTRDGRILFAGSEKAARDAAGTNAVVRDLKGATLLPGFIDAHSHFTVATMSAGGFDLRTGGRQPVSDINDVQREIRDYMQRRGLTPGGWLTVWQFDQENLTEKRYITRAELDAIAPDHPVPNGGRLY